MSAAPAQPAPRATVFGSFTWKLALRLALLVTATSAAVLATGGVLLSRQWLRNIDALHSAECLELDEIVAEVSPLTPQALERRIRGEADYDLGLYYIQIRNLSGRELYRSPNLGAQSLPSPASLAARATASLPELGEVRLTSHSGKDW